MRATEHLGKFGIKVDGEVTYDREGVARHAKTAGESRQGKFGGKSRGVGRGHHRGTGDTRRR